MSARRRPEQQPFYIYTPAESQIVTEEMRSRRGVFVKLDYVDAADDLVSGVLLSQIIFWFLPNPETGQLKTEIYREGMRWIAKERGEWWKEIRITPKQYDRAIKMLEDRGLVITTVWKWKSVNTVHITAFWEMVKARLDGDDVAIADAFKVRQRVIQGLTKGKSSNPKGESLNYPKVNPRIDERAISIDKDSEITPETTPETTDSFKIISTQDHYPENVEGRILADDLSDDEIDRHARTFVKLRSQGTTQAAVQTLFERSVHPKMHERVVARVEEIEREEEEAAASAPEPASNVKPISGD